MNGNDDESSAPEAATVMTFHAHRLVSKRSTVARALAAMHLTEQRSWHAEQHVCEEYPHSQVISTDLACCELHHIVDQSVSCTTSAQGDTQQEAKTGRQEAQ